MLIGHGFKPGTAIQTTSVCVRACMHVFGFELNISLAAILLFRNPKSRTLW